MNLLPLDIISTICRYSGYKDVVALICTCKWLTQHANQSFWKHRLATAFLINSDFADQFNWRVLSFQLADMKMDLNDIWNIHGTVPAKNCEHIRECRNIHSKGGRYIISQAVFDQLLRMNYVEAVIFILYLDRSDYGFKIICPKCVNISTFQKCYCSCVVRHAIRYSINSVNEGLLKVLINDSHADILGCLQMFVTSYGVMDCYIQMIDIVVNSPRFDITSNWLTLNKSIIDRIILRSDAVDILASLISKYKVYPPYSKAILDVIMSNQDILTVVLDKLGYREDCDDIEKFIDAVVFIAIDSDALPIAVIYKHISAPAVRSYIRASIKYVSHLVYGASQLL